MAKALAKAVGRQVVYENASETEIKGYNLMSNSSLDAGEAGGRWVELSLACKRALRKQLDISKGDLCPFKRIWRYIICSII